MTENFYFFVMVLAFRFVHLTLEFYKAT